MVIGKTRIKFIWGASRVIQANWRFGLWGYYERQQGYHHSGLAISARGVLVAGLLLLTTAYVGGTAGIYLWLSRNDFNRVTYPDVLLLPVRWDRVQAKRGQAFIAEGIADLKAQRWAAGEMLLRLGLARNPRSVEGRLALAQFYYYSQRSAQALQLLQQGMDLSPDYPGRVYLNTCLSIALQGADYDTVLKVCDRYLGANVPGLTTDERNWLLTQKLNALLGAGQPEPAMALLQQAPNDPVFNEQRVMVLFSLDRPQEALRFLQTWRKQAGVTPQILRLEVRANRETKQFDRMNALLEDLRRLAPSDPATYAFMVVQQQMAGLGREAQASLDDYLFRFGGFAANLLMVARPLAEVGTVPMLQECLRHATDQGYDQRPFWLLLAQTQLSKGDWAGASASVARLQALGTKGQSPNDLATANLVGLLANAAGSPTEGPQVLLMKLIGSQLYPFRTYRSIAETLVRARRYDGALAVIAQAEARFPTNRGLDQLKAEATQALAASQQALPAVGTDKGSPPILIAEVFFTRVDAAMKQGRWADALAMIDAVQLARPLWLGSRREEVLSREMRASHGAHDSLRMSLSARMLLDGTLDRAQLVVGYADELHAAGATSDAVLLLREVLRKLPEHARARRQLAAWTKPATAPAKDPEPAVQQAP